MEKTSYNPGKLWPIIKITVGLIRRNPELINNEEYLRATLLRNIPELSKRERCANCDASMVEYVFEFDALDAIMLLIMAREVRRKMGVESLPFTDANKIKVQSLEEASYAMKSRTTQMAKLGLIAKVATPEGKQVPGMWLITRRGFSALHGNPVPKSVRVWRNKIEARTEETVTLQEVFSGYTNKVEATLKRNKEPKSDYRGHIADYRREEWYGYGEIHDGKLI